MFQRRGHIFRCGLGAFLQQPLLMLNPRPPLRGPTMGDAPGPAATIDVPVILAVTDTLGWWEFLE